MIGPFRPAAILLLALLALTPIRASADVYWSSVASACLPDSISIGGGRYANPSDASVGPRDELTTPIVLVCHVPPKIDRQPPNQISLTYADSTGANASAGVRASLVRVSRANGARGALAAVSSDDGTATGTALRRSQQFSFLLDHAAYYYLVRIEIDRSAPNESVQCIGVALESTCGNGSISGIEQCDDANSASGDGCSSQCKIEAGYTCTGTPSVCTTGPVAASISDIKTSVVPVGTRVEVQDALVTAVKPGAGAGLFVQATQLGTAFSGIFVLTSSTPSASIGDRVTIVGKVSNGSGQIYLSSIESLEVTAPASANPTPVSVTVAQVATGGSLAQQLEGVLVQVNNSSVTAAMNAFNEFTITDSSSGTMVVDDYLYLVSPAPSVGTSYSQLIGVLAFRLSQSKLHPRSATDLIQ